ncbi:TetR/AcrR family transcriptional regulator C-terminal domain-containing protein [Microbacterium sp. NPDC091662]|uniref:TetR/AcrR family transcriptional regulator C-terminal domain-containing protein n=1 Tax=Microbacterium sp. NPDC091662 TaxID=3364211 RepID=UPI0038308927
MTSQTIAAEIAERIASGELAPGDRVPSARGITRDWGVAIATATKALALLQHRGLVVSTPGIGSVVASPGATTGPPLSTARVVSTAISMADAEGIEAISMRRIAAELDIPTMSLYRHVESKDGLVLLMIDSVLGEESFPPPSDTDWRADLEVSARLQWAGFQRHPWLAGVMSISRPQLVPNGFRYTEWCLRALAPLGLSMETMMYISVSVFSHVRALATDIAFEAEQRQDTGLTADEYMTTRSTDIAAMVSPADLPLLASLVRSDDFDLDLNALFEFGLQRLLDGIEGWVSRG